MNSGLLSIRRITVTQLRAHLRMVSSYGHSQAAGTDTAPAQLSLGTNTHLKAPLGTGLCCPSRIKQGNAETEAPYRD